jgi:hypothetical protein
MRFRLCLVLGAACSGGTHQAVIGPPPARQSQGVLSGPLCQTDHCKCRDATAPADGGAGVPEDQKKRFEVRLTSAQELWATMGPNVMYKSAEQTESCWYVDLSPGDTEVTMRSSDKSGVSAAIAIHELGTQTKSWYDTFIFNCGAPGVCSYDELDAFKAQSAEHKRGIADMCGSVKIKGLTWDAQHAPDALHPGDLLLHLVLDIYKRAPDKPHGDPTCGHGGKPPTSDES